MLATVSGAKGADSGSCQESPATPIGSAPPAQLVGSLRNGRGEKTALGQPPSPRPQLPYSESRIGLCASSDGTPQMESTIPLTGSNWLMSATLAVSP